MGKLHTLKRAIERNPEDWYFRTFPQGKLRVKSACRQRYWSKQYMGYWTPSWWGYAYKPFIRKVLEGIGISDNG